MKKKDNEDLWILKLDTVNFWEDCNCELDENDTPIKSTIEKTNRFVVDSVPSGAYIKYEEIPHMIDFLQTVYAEYQAAK